MGKTIDERVVEMRFDNDQFESGASTTLGTLQKLKNALNFSSSGDSLKELDKVANGVDFSGLGSAVDTVKEKFSALEGMALVALVNITNKAVDAGVELVKHLSIDQVTAGWEKYADKTSAVQTIMAATAQDFTDTGVQMAYVNDQLEKLNWFTDETSYNFVDMVGNIGKFTSNNIALDESVTAMQGIATWAALSGAHAGEASRAMYNLAQAVAIGRVQLIDWKSIENANMATAGFKETVLETAASMGTLTKTAEGTYATIDKGTTVTVANFNSALSEGWFTSEVLLSTLDQYGSFTNKLYEVSEATDLTATELLQWIDTYRDAGENSSQVIRDMAEETGVSVSELTAYMSELTDETYALGEKAFRAAQEAKTFKEAIDATKDAVSTGWMNTFEIIFGDYERAKVVWTDLANELWEVFASGAEARNKLLREALSVPKQAIMDSGWNELAAQIEKAGIPVDIFIDKLIKLGEEAGAIDGSSIQGIDDFVNSLKDGWLTVDMIAEAIDSFIEPMNSVGEAVASTTKTFDDFKIVVNQVIRGDFGNMEARFRALTEAGWDYKVVQEAVNKQMAGGTVEIEDFANAVLNLSEEEQRLAGYTEADIEALTALRDSLSDTKSGSELLFDGISKAYNALKSVILTIKDAWQEAFPPITADGLYDLLAGFNSLATLLNEKVKGKLEQIHSTFKGLFDLIGIGVDIVKELAKGAFSLIAPVLGEAGSGLLDITSKIGNFVSGFREFLDTNDLIAKGVDYLVQKIRDVTTAIQDWITTFLNLPIVQDVIQKVQDKFSGYIDLLTEKFPKVSRTIGQMKRVLSSLDSDSYPTVMMGWIKRLASALKDDLDSALGNVSGKIDELKGRFPGLSSAVEKVRDAFTGWVNSLKDKFPTLTSNIKNFIDSFEGFENLRLDDVIEFAKNLKAALSEDLSNAIDNFKEKFPALGSIVEQVVEKFRGLKTLDLTGIATNFDGFMSKVFSALEPIAAKFISVKDTILTAWTELAEKVAECGSAIWGAIEWVKDKFSNFSLGGVIAAGLGSSIIVISLAFGRLLNAIASPIGEIVSLITGLRGVFKGIKHVLNAAAAVEFAIAIGILTACVYALAQIDPAHLNNAVTALAGIATILVVLTGVMNKMGDLFGGIGKSKPKLWEQNASSSLVGLAVALLAIVGAFALLTNTLKGMSDKEIAASLGILAGMLVALEAVVVSWGALSKKFGALKGNLGSAITIVAFGAALLLVVKAFQELTEVDIEKINKKTLIALAEMMGGIALVMLAAKNVKIGSAFSIISVGVSLLILVKALEEIASFDVELIKEHLNSYIAVFGVFAALLYATKSAGSNAQSAGVGLLAMSAALLIMTQVVKRLGSLDAGTLAKGVIAVGVLSLFMESMLAVAKTANNGEFIKLGASMLLISVAVGILAIIAAALSMVDPAGLWNGVGAIAALIVCMDSLILVSKYAGKTSEVQGTLIALTVCIGVLATAIGVLSLLNPDNVMNAAEALSMLLVVFGVLEIMTGYSKVTTESIVAVTALTVVVGLIAAVLGVLASFEFANLLETSEALSLLLLSLAGALAIVGPVGALGPSAMTTAVLGLTGLVTAIGIVALVFEAIILALANIDGAEDFARNAIPVLEAIGEGLGAFVGGIGVGIADALEPIAQKLKLFANAVGQIDADSFDGIAALSDVILSLAKAEFMNALSGLFGFFTGGNDLSGLSEKLTQLGEGVAGYASAISGISNMNAVIASGAVADMLVELANKLPKEGGLVQAIFGTATDLGTFGTQLVAYGRAIVAYAATGVQNIDAETLKGGVEVGEMLRDLAETLPKSGGLVQAIFGSQDLGEFGTQLRKYGEALVDYANSGVADINVDALQAGVDAGASLAELANAIPDSSLFAQLFGSQDLGVFGSQLLAYGKALTEYAQLDGIKEIDTVTLTGAIAAGAGLVSLANAIPDSSIFGRLFGQQDLGAFGDQLKKFGKGLADFAEAIGKSFDPSPIITSVTAATSVVTFSKLAANTDFTNLSTFGSNLNNFGVYMASYAESVSGFKSTGPTENLVTAATSLRILAVQLVGVPSDSLTDFSKNLEKFGKNMTKYYDSVSSIGDPSVLIAVNTALGGLVSFAMSIGGVDTNGLMAFAEGLADFGEALSSSYAVIAAIPAGSFTGIITEINNLVTAIQAVSNVKAAVLTDLATELFNAASKAITSFSSEFINSNSVVTAAIVVFRSYAVRAINTESNTISKSATDAGKNIVTSFSAAITVNQNMATSTITMFATAVINTLRTGLPNATFTSIGRTVVQTFANAVTSTKPTATSAVSILATAVITTLRNGLPESTFRSIGQTVVNGLANGINDRYNATSAGSNLGAAVVSSVGNAMTYSMFYSIGQNVGNGLAGGIHSKINEISNAAIYAAQTAVRSAKNTLGIHSPSRVFGDMGINCDMSFANHMIATAGVVESAAEEMSNSAIDPVKTAIDEISDMVGNGFDDDPHPVITPVIDLSNVRAGANELRKILKELDANVSSSMATAAALSAKRAQAYKESISEAANMQNVEQALAKLSENPSTVFQNTFNITSTDPEAAAEEVSRVIQHQYERRSAIWGS